MYTNLPTNVDYEKVSKQCLTQSLNLLFNVIQDFKYSHDCIDDNLDINKIWSYNAGTLRTSLILLHQGIETFMKSIVCKTSPFLLLETKRSEWSTLPSRKDKDFNSQYTIAGESLLTTFCAVNNVVEINNELIDFIENIRENRNRAMHGASTFSIQPKELFENILKTFNYFFGKRSWFETLGMYDIANPVFGYINPEYETAISFEYLDFAFFMLGKNLNKYLHADITGRKYFCPSCKNLIENEGGEIESKWAFLRPNSPNSNTIHCVNCQIVFSVTRKSCTVNECKGNVIYIDEEKNRFVLHVFIQELELLQ